MIDTELRQLFESAVADTPPDSTDLDRAVREGSRRRHKRQVAVSTACAAATVLVVAVSATVARSGPDGALPLSSDPAVTPSVSSSQDVDDPEDVAAQTAENRRLAKAASRAALESLPLPDGAVRLSGKPAGWPDTFMSLGPSDGRLTEEGWWAVPLSSAEVADFLTHHSPEGMRHPDSEGSVIDDGGSDGILSTEYDPVRSTNPSAFTDPAMLVQFKQLGDRTVLRANTFLSARGAVSQQHRVTDEVTAVQIDRIVPKKGSNRGENVQLPTVRLTGPGDSGAIGRLVGAFNALSGGTTAGFVSCPFPGDPRPEITVTFSTRSGDGTVGTVTAELPTYCFGQMTVSVNGHQLDGTLDPGSWQELVDEVTDAHR